MAAGVAPGGAAGGAADSLIGMADIDAAIKEMSESPHIVMLRRCSQQEKALLASLTLVLRRSGSAEAAMEEVAAQHLDLCRSEALREPSLDGLCAIACRLGACRILLCEPGAKHRLQKVQLNVSSDDVAFALKNDEELPWLAKYLR